MAVSDTVGPTGKAQGKLRPAWANSWFNGSYASNRPVAMQRIVIDKPYEFVPPVRSPFWPWLLKNFLPHWLDKYYGITSIEYRGLEHYEASLRAGHGILIAPNHCRPSDPLVVGMLVKRVGRPLYLMASWHLFMQSRLQYWLLRLGGAFSVYREGLDRTAINTAIDALVEGHRPLVIFPEGAVNRANDRQEPLLEGTALIARRAAKKRSKEGSGKVVLHPVALKYVFGGNLEKAVGGVLDDIERRLSWQPQTHLPMLERIRKVGHGLLTLKELEYFDHGYTGDFAPRIQRLVDHLLVPLEDEWVRGNHDGGAIVRVKRLRSAIVPDLASGELSEAERARRWRQLADCYLAQSLSMYPPDYLRTYPSPERILETVERFEEDLTDEARVHRPLHVIVQVDEAIEVTPDRPRGGTDPLMEQLERRLKAMLLDLSHEGGKPVQIPESWQPQSV